MQGLSDRESKRLIRYHGQSIRLLKEAIEQARQGRWLRCEDLLWGGLTLAVKGVALSRGDELADQLAVEDYAQKLGNEHRDRRIREAFTRLRTFTETAHAVQESRARGDRLIASFEDLSGAVERLWGLLPMDQVWGLMPEPEPSDHEDWDERR